MECIAYHHHHRFEGLRQVSSTVCWFQAAPTGGKIFGCYHGYYSTPWLRNNITTIILSEQLLWVLTSYEMYSLRQRNSSSAVILLALDLSHFRQQPVQSAPTVAFAAARSP